MMGGEGCVREWDVAGSFEFIMDEVRLGAYWEYGITELGIQWRGMVGGRRPEQSFAPPCYLQLGCRRGVGYFPTG